MEAVVHGGTAATWVTERLLLPVAVLACMTLNLTFRHAITSYETNIHIIIVQNLSVAQSTIFLAVVSFGCWHQNEGRYQTDRIHQEGRVCCWRWARHPGGGGGGGEDAGRTAGMSVTPSTKLWTSLWQLLKQTHWTLLPKVTAQEIIPTCCLLLP